MNELSQFDVEVENDPDALARELEATFRSRIDALAAVPWFRYRMLGIGAASLFSLVSEKGLAWRMRKADVFGLIAPVTGMASIKTDDGGVTATSQTTLLFKGGTIALEWSPRSTAFGVTVSASPLFRQLDRLQERRTPRTTPLRAVLQRDDPECAPLVHLMQHVAAEGIRTSPLFGIVGASPSLDGLFVAAMTAAARGPLQSEPLSTNISPRILRRAEAYLADNLAEPLDLERLARASEASPRTVFRVFRRFRNTSPARYLQDLRLSRARELLCDNRETRRVDEIAAAIGFGHYSTFWRAYIEKFGETPSETRRAAFRGKN